MSSSLRSRAGRRLRRWARCSLGCRPVPSSGPSAFRPPPRSTSGASPSTSARRPRASRSMYSAVRVGVVQLTLGDRAYDITTRTLVMGIVNRTPDSFFDQGRYFDMDASLNLAEELVAAGADIIDVGGVKAGPGPEVDEQDELERVLPAIEALHSRIDVPLSVDTWRAEVARQAYEAGAVVGNDISGFADPNYLAVSAAAGATVVATHIRLAPRVPDPEPEYPNDDVVTAV